MSDPTPPQQPPYTNVPYTDVPAGGPAAYPPPPGAYVPPPGAYSPVAASTGLSENSAAALAYVTIIPAIIFLVLEPYNKMRLVKFHSIQCLGLATASFVLQVGLTIVSLFLHFIPLIGILFSLVHLAVFLVIFVAWLMCIIKASQGQWFKLPVIGDFAETQARR
jgi:uncharacterized membrane protein